ncbi:hypothetical protein Bbelb_015780 [Branchiostoma belcheri]|nr:hypothetical protein Bbelb_015780 [Branchiostoma belcheri]
MPTCDNVGSGVQRREDGHFVFHWRVWRSTIGHSWHLERFKQEWGLLDIPRDQNCCITVKQEGSRCLFRPLLKLRHLWRVWLSSGGYQIIIHLKGRDYPPQGQAENLASVII